MEYRFDYSLVIATNTYRQSLVDIVNSVLAIESLNCIIVVNGSEPKPFADRYSESLGVPRVRVFTVPQPGKSVALNWFLKDVVNDRSFIIFSDDDIIINSQVIEKFIESVERNGRGYFYGGGMDVVRRVEVNPHLLRFYPSSIRGLSDDELMSRSIFLGCNWGAFAADLQAAGYFSPYFGPGSITGSVGQESQMMHKLLRLGIKPFPIRNCRVIHLAPENYHRQEWLLRRRFREGILKGLLNKKNIWKILIVHLVKLYSKDRLKRRLNINHFFGMVYSLKYYFKKIE